jgi:hypothetical protein
LQDDSDTRDAHFGFLFQHLVAMFQTLALQQLGKLTNPITGKLERDLHQARITIDMLQMLKEKTAGNLEHSEQVLLDRALLDLQMNYVDEVSRKEEQPQQDETLSAEREKQDQEPTEKVAEQQKAEPEGKKAAAGKKGGGPASGKKHTIKSAKRKGKGAQKKPEGNK